MSYERLNLIDGQRWKAEHVKHIEDGIVQNESDISTNASKLESALVSETNARTSGDNSLRTDLNTEIDNRTTADESLSKSIDTEVTNRRTADSNLEESLTLKINDVMISVDTTQRNVDTEVTNRELAIDTVNTRIDATDKSVSDEVTNRGKAIDEVKSLISDSNVRIDKEISDREAAITEVKSLISSSDTAITDEASKRELADSALQSNIDKEILDRKASDSDLEGKIQNVNSDLSTEVTNRQADTVSLTELINKEVEDRKAAIEDAKSSSGSVQTNLDTEIANRITSDETLQANIDKEILDRESAIDDVNKSISDTNLNLGTEVTTRESDVASLTSALSKEVTDRTDGIKVVTDSLSIVKSDLTTETSTRKASDDEIKSNLSTETSERKSADTALSNEIAEVRLNLNTEVEDRAKADNEIKESLAVEISDRKSVISTLETSVVDIRDNYVKKIPGKGLSTSDFTADEKAKLATVESGAQANIIESISVNGTKLVPTAKSVVILIPTKVSELTNDSDYAKKAVTLAGYGISDAYTKAEIDGKLVSVMTYKGQVSTVSDLPTEGVSTGDVYDVVATGHNYAWNGSSWDDLGGTIDLSNYYTKDVVDTKLDTKVDAIPGKQLSTNDYTAAEKTKLASIETGATYVIVDSVLNDTSVNPVQGKVIKSALDSKANSSDVKNTTDEINSKLTQEISDRKSADEAFDNRFSNIDSTYVKKDGSKVLSTNDYTTLEKTKLSNIEDGANKTIVDNLLSSTSENPVQNKVVTSAIGAKADKTYVDESVAGFSDALTLETTERKSDVGQLTTSINNVIENYVQKVTGKGLSTNDYTTDDKNKLNGIATGATKVIVDSTLSDTTENPVQGKVIKAAIDLKMSSSDAIDLFVKKVVGKGLSTFDYDLDAKNTIAKLTDFINNYTVDNELSLDSLNPVQNKVITTVVESSLANISEVQAALEVLKTDVESTYVKKIDGKGLSTNDFTNELREKVESSIVITVDSELSTTSINPVRNSVITTELNKKANSSDIESTYVKIDGSKVLSDNNYTTDEKTKLSGIESGATKVIVDSVMSATSTNPVQNKVIYESISKKANTSDIESDYVKKDGSKVLSTNDYTTVEKNKLSMIESGAQVNVIETIKVNGSELTPSDKSVDISIPTKVSQILNDSQYVTETELKNRLASVVTYKGSKDTYAELLALTDMEVGDVWNVVDKENHNFAWSGELWDDLGGDVNLSNYFTKDEVTSKLATKVDVVSGKQLSTNDYTTDEKTKLAGIESSAQVNKIESISVNGSEVTPSGTSVALTIPTKTSELTNDSSYVTESKVDSKLGSYYTKDEIDGTDVTYIVKCQLS